MAATVTVRAYTNNEYSELTYGIKSKYIIDIRDLLSKAGCHAQPIGDKEIFDEGVRNAVITFQQRNGIKVTGNIDSNTLYELLEVTNTEMPDIIYSENDTGESNTEQAELSGQPHFDSFFSKEYDRDVRKNNQDIVIVLGDNSVVKTIHNVYMRGVSTEYDTSGNPISEVYEFIGQDLTESTELKDKDKYK